MADLDTLARRVASLEKDNTRLGKRVEDLEVLLARVTQVVRSLDPGANIPVRAPGWTRDIPPFAKESPS